MHTPTVIDDYSNFWFGPDSDPMQYTFCMLRGREAGKALIIITGVGNAIWNRYLVDGRADIPVNLLPALIKLYDRWNSSYFIPSYLLKLYPSFL